MKYQMYIHKAYSFSLLVKYVIEQEKKATQAEGSFVVEFKTRSIASWIVSTQIIHIPFVQNSKI